MDSTWIADNAEKTGIVGILAFNIVSLIRGWVVPATTHAEILKERDTLRTRLDEANARDLRRLEKVESDLAVALGRGK